MESMYIISAIAGSFAMFLIERLTFIDAYKKGYEKGFADCVERRQREEMMKDVFKK